MLKSFEHSCEILMSLSVYDAGKTIFFLPMLAAIDMNTYSFAFHADSLVGEKRNQFLDSLERIPRGSPKLDSSKKYISLQTYAIAMKAPFLKEKISSFIINLNEKNKLSAKPESEIYQREFKTILCDLFARFLLKNYHGLLEREHENAWFWRIRLLNSISDEKVWEAMAGFQTLTCKQQKKLIKSLSSK